MRPRTLWWTAAGSVGCGTVLLMLVVIRWTPLEGADRWLTRHLHQSALDHPGWVEVNRILTDWVWDPQTIRLLMLVAVVILALRRAWRAVLWVGLVLLVELIVQHGLKEAVARPRPEFPDPVHLSPGWAFPSGHTMTATVCCGLLLILVLRLAAGYPLWQAVILGVVVLSVVGVGFTRIFLGVHWFSDVLGGWLFGVAVLASCTAVLGPLGSPDATVRSGRQTR